MHIKKVVLFIILFITGLSFGQELIWPTDASHAMTSSFAESRPGRFHAGLDIKTWGREGYKIFAIASGYVSRIRVSPYGYGRAIYFTLDTGETVVYGHQKKFNAELEEYVRRQQEKRGVYTLQLYPPSTRFRYSQGDVLGYTGQTGVGYPHLHFEIRDKASRPINPFLLGYKVQDSVAPTVTRISVMPLDAYSTVNGDWRPVLLRVIPVGNHHYRLAKPILACGRIAFGVSAFDRMDGVANKFGTYKNELLVDDQVVFSATYDRFSYAENNQATLDRDFRFYVRGKGLYYNLFRDIGNHLSFYSNEKKFYGVLNFGDFQCAKASGGEVGPEAVGIFTPYTDGIVSVSDTMHSFKIIVRDFWGNQSVVDGTLLHDKRNSINLDIDSATWTGRVCYNNGLRVKRCAISVSMDRGRTWHRFSTIKNAESVLLTSTSENVAQKQDISFNLPSVVPGNELYLKVQAQDDDGEKSFPAFTVVGDQPLQSVSLDPSFSIESEFYDHYVRLEFTSANAFFAPPQIVGIHDNGKKETLQLIQKSPREFYGSWPLKKDDLGPIPLAITAFDQSGKRSMQKRWLLFNTVRKGEVKTIRTEDGLCTINFSRSSLFKDIFMRTLSDSEALYEFPSCEIIGKIYSIEPKDVALNKGATVSIKYGSDPQPDKLAIYYLIGKKKWVFFGNERNSALNTISGHVTSFGTHCLIRDTVPPEIKYLYPADGSHIANVTPTLKAVFKDVLSGIRGDENMKMILDGKKMIAEYDPEKLLLFCRVRQPLAKGQHVLELHVRDRCGNASQQTHSFWVN